MCQIHRGTTVIHGRSQFTQMHADLGSAQVAGEAQDELLSRRPQLASTVVLGTTLETTRYAFGRTTRRWPPVVLNRLNAAELQRGLLPRPGGQGVECGATWPGAGEKYGRPVSTDQMALIAGSSRFLIKAARRAAPPHPLGHADQAGPHVTQAVQRTAVFLALDYPAPGRRI